MENQEERNYMEILQESNIYLNQILVAHRDSNFKLFRTALLKLEIILGSLKNDIEQKEFK